MYRDLKDSVTTDEKDWGPTFPARIERKYRIWIPKIIREMLDLKEGDIVEVRLRVIRKKSVLR